MKRILLLFAGLLPLSPVPAQSYADKDARMKADVALFQERTLQIDHLAGNMQSMDDSRRMVDLIAAIFANDLPPAWSTRSIRERIALAEYESASDHARLISEQRLVDAWNQHMRTIGASPDAIVTVAEIHNLRDGSYSMARFLWSRGSRNFWSMPSIYAIGSDGKIADGCTAVEVLRILYDLSNQFNNLRGARERVKQGVMISDTLKPVPQGVAGVKMTTRVSGSVAVRDSPVEDAEIRFLREHGTRASNQAIEALLDGLFPS